MDASVILFYVIAVLLVTSSLMVVFLRNVVHCAMALVAALFLIAILFLMLHAPMLGVLQVLVYAGAIMVLFLFVIMFLNPNAVEPRRKLWWGFGSLGALLFAASLAALLVSNGKFLATPVAVTELFGSPEMLGQSLFTEFVLPFEIASVLLLVAIVGAVVLAKREP
jgi:NADH-quinone oxidoreductase subunit J